MTEKLGVDRSFRNRTAVYRYILSVFTGTVGMDDTGKNLFPDSALSGYQYGQICRGYLGSNIDGPI